MARPKGSKNNGEEKEIEKSETKVNQVSANKEKLEAVKLAQDAINKKFGKGSIIMLGASTAVRTEVMPTGALTLDIALGVGGLPKGRIIELIGPESTGKSSLALSIVRKCQQKGGIAAYVDAENAMDLEYAQKIGIDVDNLLFSQPGTGEEGLEIVETLVRSGSVDLIVVDSVAALVPKAEIEGEMGDSHMGLQARLMSQAMRKLTGVISKSKTIVIFINQIREKIGVMFGSPETTPGGRALKFYSSVRMDIRRVEPIKKGEVILGNHVKVKMVKNKVGPPFKEAHFNIIFGKGIQEMGAVLDAAVDQGIIGKSGTWFNYGDVKIGQGKDSAIVWLEENKDKAEDISIKTMEKAMSKMDIKEDVVVEGSEDTPVDEDPTV